MKGDPLEKLDLTRVRENLPFEAERDGVVARMVEDVREQQLRKKNELVSVALIRILDVAQMMGLDNEEMRRVWNYLLFHDAIPEMEEPDGDVMERVIAEAEELTGLTVACETRPVEFDGARATFPFRVRIVRKNREE